MRQVKMAMENLWPRSETTILINLWKSFPVLYDSSMENYYSKQVRNKTMDYIVIELEKLGIRKTVIQVKRKMKTLQTQLGKERKRKISQDFEPKLWCFNELSFIWPSSFSYNAHVEQDISSDSSDTRTTKKSLKTVEAMQEFETEDIKWTRSETTVLIDLWKSSPILYDSSMTNYNNMQLRNITIDVIVKELEKVGIRKTAIQVKKKLKTLQTQLSKERKKKRLAQDYEPKLWCFNELSFIWPYSFSYNAHGEQDISSDSSDTRTTKKSLKSVEPMQELETEDIKWTRSEATVLIDLWKSCPILYDSSMKNYCSKQVKYKTMDYIVKELEKVGIRKTVLQVKKKLKTLQTQLCKLRKKKRLAQDYEPKLWCFNELSFLCHSSFSPNITKNDFDGVHDISSVSSGSIINNSLDEVKPMEELETEETVQTSFSYPSNGNIPLKRYKQRKEVNKIAEDLKELNKNNNLIKEYIESFSEFDEGETPLYHPIRNDTESEKLEERQEAFCKYLAIELKQITNDDLFDELKFEILQLVSKKMKHQSNILPEEHPINIKDYISFIS